MVFFLLCDKQPTRIAGIILAVCRLREYTLRFGQAKLIQTEKKETIHGFSTTLTDMSSKSHVREQRLRKDELWHISKRTIKHIQTFVEVQQPSLYNVRCRQNYVEEVSH